jgi:hypothetical protein
MAVNRDDRDLRNQTPDPDRPEVKHEERDVNAWAVGKFAIGLTLLCIAVVLLIAGLFRYFQGRENAAQAPPGPGTESNVSREPPAPRLQDAPISDLKQMRDAENQILGTYAWVDREHGIVRLPIDRAIDVLAQRGLPSSPAAADQTGVSVPTDSGLGPEMVAPGGPLSNELNSPAKQ